MSFCGILVHSVWQLKFHSASVTKVVTLNCKMFFYGWNQIAISIFFFPEWRFFWAILSDTSAQLSISIEWGERFGENLSIQSVRLMMAILFQNESNMYWQNISNIKLHDCIFAANVQAFVSTIMVKMCSFEHVTNILPKIISTVTN